MQNIFFQIKLCLKPIFFTQLADARPKTARKTEIRNTLGVQTSTGTYNFSLSIIMEQCWSHPVPSKDISSVSYQLKETDVTAWEYSLTSQKDCMAIPNLALLFTALFWTTSKMRLCASVSGHVLKSNNLLDQLPVT